jgi:hypothetical protein
VYKLIDNILNRFGKCFKRKSAFNYFVIAVIGLLLRRDTRGLSSIISALRLKPQYYDNLVHFFRSTAFELSDLVKTWIELVFAFTTLLTVSNCPVLIGDNIKISKEARKMPGIKKLHQDSENSGKSEYIFGHNHGVVGVIAKAGSQLACIPLMSEIQDGIHQIENLSKQIAATKETEAPKDSIVARMVKQAAKIVLHIGKPSFLVLDAYFSTKVAFETADKTIDSQGKALLTLIVRAKSNFVAFTQPPEVTVKRRGRPRKYGEQVCFKNVFETWSDRFQNAEVVLYGKKEVIKYLCLDLLWKPLGRIVRFVLVKHGSTPFILMCSDLNVPALQIVELYSYRFKVEVTFKSLKQTLGSFCYHFWTTAMPKLSRKITETDLSKVTDPKDKQRIVAAARAINVFVFIGCVAMGILQMISLHYPVNVWRCFTGWLRTKRLRVTSVETVRSALQEEVLWNFGKLREFGTLQLIHQLQRESLYLYEEDAS